MEMAESQEPGRFLVGLAGEITNNVTKGLQNVGQRFTNHLADLLTVISAQGICAQGTGYSREQVHLMGNLPNLGTGLSKLRSIYY